MDLPSKVITDPQISDAKTQYDAICKKVLSDKYILANILKGCVPDFKECSIEEIATQYIETVFEPGSIGVDVDSTNALPDTIIGASTEDTTLTEGTVRYDVRFDARTPDNSGKVLLIINVEAQSNYNPGYPLIKRAIYYASRLISAQKGKYWSKSNYSELHRVYTIWICLKPPKEAKGFINSYTLAEKHLYGTYSLPAEHYDLINVVMVGLSNNPTENALVNLLSTVLSGQATQAEKAAALRKNSVPCKNLEGEVMSMCNLSQAVLQEGIEKGIKQGLAKGHAEGHAEGIQNQLIKSVKALMETTESFDEAVALLRLTPEEIKIVKEQMDI